MKKSALFMACCIGLMLFASCSKEVQPTINAVTDPGYASQNSEVFSGDPILVGFNVTGENLIQITMIAEQNGSAIFTDSQTLDNVVTYSYAKTFTIDATGTVTIRGTVTDAKGHTATTSFDIRYNEKPNAKFVGHYEGDILISGDVTIETSMMGSMSEVMEEQPFATIVDIEPGESIIEVLATITINQQSNTVKGTVDGYKVTFEALNSTFNYNYPYEPMGITIPISLDMTYAITGQLNGNQLNLNGTCNGNGNNMFGTINLANGTVTGTLDKTR